MVAQLDLPDSLKATCLRRYSLQPLLVLHELTGTLLPGLTVLKPLVPKTEKTFLTSEL
jgi:hypothetical protein